MKWLYLSPETGPHIARLRSRLPAGFELELRDGDDHEALLALAPAIEGLICGLPSRELLAKATKLAYLVVPYAGLPQRSQELMADFPRVSVLNSHYNSRYAAEHAWALLLAAAKRIEPASAGLRRGDWTMRYEGPLSVSLQGKRLLLVGYGAIGRALLPMARAFGMSVTAVKRKGEAAPELDAVGVAADLPAMVAEADALIVSLPGSAATAGLIGHEAFAAMKPGTLFVNVGRGAAVDEDAFFQALRAGKIGAAGIDTWWRYPAKEAERGDTAPSRHDLGEFENLVMSPHRASHCEGREEARVDALVEILDSIARGRPINRVDLEAGY